MSKVVALTYYQKMVKSKVLSNVDKTNSREEIDPTLSKMDKEVLSNMDESSEHNTRKEIAKDLG